MQSGDDILAAACSSLNRLAGASVFHAKKFNFCLGRQMLRGISACHRLCSYSWRIQNKRG